MESKVERQERKAKMRSLMKGVTGMTPEKRAALAAAVPGIVNTVGHVLSIKNTVLLSMQAGGRGLTIVGGYKQWLAVGRQVRQGEHGMAIWFPGQVRTHDANGADLIDAEVRFMVGTVFDISQTDEITGVTA